MKKPLSLEKQIEQILRKYAPVFYNKEQYIKNCTQAIMKIIKPM